MSRRRRCDRGTTTTFHCSSRRPSPTNIRATFGRPMRGHSQTGRGDTTRMENVEEKRVSQTWAAFPPPASMRVPGHVAVSSSSYVGGRAEADGGRTPPVPIRRHHHQRRERIWSEGREEREIVRIIFFFFTENSFIIMKSFLRNKISSAQCDLRAEGERHFALHDPESPPLPPLGHIIFAFRARRLRAAGDATRCAHNNGVTFC